jgi:hypothetical protein
MTTKVTAVSPAAALARQREVQNRRWEAPALTQDERLLRIKAMGQRINDYVGFMSQASGPNGASAEAKEKAVTAFYELMMIAVSQLGRIHEKLQLA